MRSGLVVALVLAALAASAPALAADDARARAAEAYRRGTAAHDRGDHKEAARQFALADAIAPNPVALRAALDAAVDADDPVLGAELVERAARAPADAALAASVEAARQKLASRAGKIEVVCPPAATCDAKLDGAPLRVGEATWTRTGSHTVVVEVDGAPRTKVIEVEAGRTATVTVDAAPPPEAEAAPSPASPEEGTRPEPTPAAGGPSRAAFLVAGSLTAAAGVTGLVFGWQAKTSHEDFVGAGCDRVAFSGCTSMKEEGESAQRTANILFAVTGGLAVSTAVIAIFFTDRSPAPKASARAAPFVMPARGGAAMGWSGRF